MTFDSQDDQPVKFINALEPMYFDARTLSEMAKNFFDIAQSVAFLPYDPSDDRDLAAAALSEGATIRLKFQGSIRLLFHCHAWSGTATLVGVGTPKQIELYSSHPAEKWVEIDVEDPTTMNECLLVTGISPADKAALGAQMWLRGVEFHSRQPWLPTSLPASSTCDLVFGHVGSFLVPHQDRIISRRIRTSGIWAPHDVEFFSKVIRPSSTVLDIGANIGHHSVTFCRMVGSAGRVIGFEPQSFIHAFAATNLILNNCNNGTVERLCLGDSEGSITMSPISYRSEANFGALGVCIDQDNTGEVVPLTTLDKFIETHYDGALDVDFIKIDVQSFELYVLRGAEATLKRCMPNVFLEISPYWMANRGYSYKEIYEFMFDLGYSCQHFGSHFEIDEGMRIWNGNKSEEWDAYFFVEK